MRYSQPYSATGGFEKQPILGLTSPLITGRLFYSSSPVPQSVSVL